MQADILAGLGRYSVILIGAPGILTEELPSLSSTDDILFLKPLSERRARILSVVTDSSNPRFGQPEYYLVYLGTPTSASNETDQPLLGQSKSEIVHWTRIIHVAEGTLEDDIFGKPRLRAVWNYLDDLDKLCGGGAEAAWKRMNPGMHIDIDPEIELDDTGAKDLESQLSEYDHNLRRTIQTSGAKITLLSGNVSIYGANADTQIKLISATTGLPHRILVGSERGELSSSQDRDNLGDRVTERREEFGIPLGRKIIDRLIEYGALPAPKTGVYDISWPDTEDLNEQSKATIALTIAQANQANVLAGGGLILNNDEMRDEIYGLEPLEDEIDADPASDPTDDDPNGDSTTGDSDSDTSVTNDIGKAVLDNILDKSKTAN